MVPDFQDLTPDRIIHAVESHTDLSFTGLTSPLPSYINRVFELQTDGEERYVVKFYRPGRWSPEALREEHEFMEDCYDMDIPVAVPEILNTDDTLGITEEGIYFALFPRMGGRLWEFRGDEDQWYRLGQLLGRVHTAGAEYAAKHRPVLHPGASFRSDCRDILEKGWIPPGREEAFRSVTDNIRELITPLFEGHESIRIHGDFHCGNILDRLDEGLMLIDFDDMAMGPPVQDVWLLMPGHAAECRREFFMLMDGYQEFRTMNPGDMALIEPLRAMRMVYYLAWCGRQKDDYRFRHHFPDWGSDHFWEKEILDLSNQLQEIRDFIEES